MNSTEILKSTETDNYSPNLINSDLDLLNKVKQVIELTGCSNDIAVTTLFDSNYNIEIAIDKIFDQTQRTLVGENKASSDWKKVAKYKKKQSSIELNQNEYHINFDTKEGTESKVFNEKSRPFRGSGRGRGRFIQNNDRSYENFNTKPQNIEKDDSNEFQGNKSAMLRGRGRRSQFRLNSNRGRSKHYTNQDAYEENIDDDRLHVESNKWNSGYEACNDCLSDTTGKWNEYSEFEKSFDNNSEEAPNNDHNSALNMDKFENHLPDPCTETSGEKKAQISKECISKPTQENLLELVAKSTNKVDIFGGFSKTKPPKTSAKVPSEPVKLLMNTSAKSCFNFNFGLNFQDYAPHSMKSIESTSESFISKIITNSQTQPQQQFDGMSGSKKLVSPGESSSFHTEHESHLPTSSSNSRLVHTVVDKSNSDIPLKSVDMFSNSPVSVVNHHRTNMEVPDKKMSSIPASPGNSYKLSECASNNHQSLNTAILSSPSQLCAPPGMSNAHLLQQFQNNPQYFSLLNIPNGSSIFGSCNIGAQVNDFGDLNSGPEDSHSQQHQGFLHNDSVAKEFINQKSSVATSSCSSNPKHGSGSLGNMANSSGPVMLSKISDSDNSSHLSAMPMSNICCFPQVYMNNFAANFMPPPVAPGNHNSSSSSHQSVDGGTQAPPDIPNKSSAHSQPQQVPPQMYNTHRNYTPMQDDYIESAAKYDEMMQSKQQQKFQRPQNYVSGYGASKSEEVGVIDIDKSQSGATSTGVPGNGPSKLPQSNGTAQMNRQSVTQNINRANQHQIQQQQQQATVSNDPRFLAAFHHQHSNHPFSNNMFNCVTATGAHPAVPHPYTMAHQGGPLQQLHPQLHLLQQQMHNFPQSYQFQEHLITSMVSNPSSRTNISQGSGSSGNQSRSNRSNNQLWHPSN